MSNGSSVRALTNRRTDAHTHQTDSIPSTTDAGGNKLDQAVVGCSTNSRFHHRLDAIDTLGSFPNCSNKEGD